MAVFAHRGLSDDLIRRLDEFRGDEDFVSLYESYNWRNDNHAGGFPDIHRLELQFRERRESGGFTLDDICAVAEWGGLFEATMMKPDPPKREAIKIRSEYTFKEVAKFLSAPYGSSGRYNLKDGLGILAEQLRRSISGIGITNATKVLRFALPEQYGVIDTRIVRAFGIKKGSQCWLKMSLTPSGGSIDESYNTEPWTPWDDEYRTWINILRYFACKLPNNCPHPQNFVDSGLRTKGVWTCADVEMALFAYAR